MFPAAAFVALSPRWRIEARNQSWNMEVDLEVYCRSFKRVRGRATTTTTNGEDKEFRRRFNPKKLDNRCSAASAGGSHCATTGNVFCLFFPIRVEAGCRIPVRRSVRPAQAKIKPMPQGQLEKLRFFDLRTGSVDARREKTPRIFTEKNRDFGGQGPTRAVQLREKVAAGQASEKSLRLCRVRRF